MRVHPWREGYERSIRRKLSRSRNKTELDTPVLWIDLPLIETNIVQMAALLAESRSMLRPNAKTHKSPALTYMQIAAWAIGVICTKLGEAELAAFLCSDESPYIAITTFDISTAAA